jgi:iron complex transport system permease protein
MFRSKTLFFTWVSLLLTIAILCAIAFGAVPISPGDMLGGLQHLLQGRSPANIYEGVFTEIRLPRVLLCSVTGAILGVSGVLMQGLFRNPLVEPGLIGTSSGAAFGASIVFVLAPSLPLALKSLTGPLLVPLFAFLGGLLATAAVYSLASAGKKASTMSILLVGIAINAVGLSGTGFMSYLARDPQARSITFWNLGTVSGASWPQVLIVSLIAALTFVLAFRYSKELNALLLGEQEAFYLGVNSERLKRKLMLLNTAMVAVATAFVGVIGFVGLVVPHMVRLAIGSDHKRLLPASLLGGALLLNLADLSARLLLRPAEIPIGIITSLVGAPVFILLLKRYHVLSTEGGDHD